MTIIIIMQIEIESAEMDIEIVSVNETVTKKDREIETGRTYTNM